MNGNKKGKKSKNQKKNVKKASGIVHGLLQNCPYPYDFSRFFATNLLTIECPNICDNIFSLLFTPNRDDLKLAIDKWELPGVIFCVEQQLNKGEQCTRLEIDYSSAESIKNLQECAKNPDLFFGLIEMSLSVGKTKEQHYACIRLDWNDKKNECIPSFFSHRLLQGRDQLNEKMKEPIQIHGMVPFVQGVPSFDQELAEITFFNDSLSKLLVSIPFCEPINKGIHYIYPNWRNPRSSPSKHAFTIRPNKGARLKITFQLPRTKEGLRKMAENNEYVWIEIRLQEDGYQKSICTPKIDWLHFTLRWDENKKWMGKLSRTPPRTLTPEERDQKKQEEKQQPFTVKLS